MKLKSRLDKQVKINTPIVFLASLLAILLWVFISLSQSYQMNMDIPFRLVNLPPGFSSSSKLAETIHLKLRTTGWRLLALHLSSGFIFQVSGNQLKESGIISLKDAVSENSWMTDDIKILDISPDEIRIGYEKTISRQKKVSLLANLTYKDGFGLARAPVIQPENIIVYGSRKLLQQVDSIVTDLVTFENVEKGFSEDVTLHPINGVQLQPEKVRVFFDVQRIVESKIVNIPVDVINVPPDRKVVLSPAEITIGMRGGIEYLGRIKQEECKAIIEYKDIIADSTGYVEPRIYMPDFILKTYIEPQRIKTIIKRY